MSLSQSLTEIANLYNVAEILVFGSRAAEIASLVRGSPTETSHAASDVDVGVLFQLGRQATARDKARLAAALEDLFDVGRVDLESLAEADPFLAAEAVRGERLFVRDADAADEYELYVLRRAGDLAPFERERIAQILGVGQ